MATRTEATTNERGRRPAQTPFKGTPGETWTPRTWHGFLSMSSLYDLNSPACEDRVLTHQRSTADQKMAFFVGGFMLLVFVAWDLVVALFWLVALPIKAISALVHRVGHTGCSAPSSQGGKAKENAEQNMMATWGVVKTNQAAATRMVELFEMVSANPELKGVLSPAELRPVESMEQARTRSAKRSAKSQPPPWPSRVL